MDIYTHVFNKREALLKVMLEADEEEHASRTRQRVERPAQGSTSARKNSALTLSSLPPDDDFSWYEEEE